MSRVRDAIITEIKGAKDHFFDPYLDRHILAVDADISGVIVPEAEWLAGYFSEPVRFSVATRKDSPLDGRFMVTVELDLTRRDPNVSVTGMLMMPDGSCRSVNISHSSGTPSSWEVAVMDARWSVQLSIDAALELLGIEGADRTQRPERPQRELSFFASLTGRKRA